MWLKYLKWLKTLDLKKKTLKIITPLNPLYKKNSNSTKKKVFARLYTKNDRFRKAMFNHKYWARILKPIDFYQYCT